MNDFLLKKKKDNYLYLNQKNMQRLWGFNNKFTAFSSSKSSYCDNLLLKNNITKNLIFSVSIHVKHSFFISRYAPECDEDSIKER